MLHFISKDFAFRDFIIAQKPEYVSLGICIRCLILKLLSAIECYVKTVYMVYDQMLHIRPGS